MDIDTPVGTPTAPADSRDTPDTERGAAAPQAPLPLVSSPSANASAVARRSRNAENPVY